MAETLPVARRASAHDHCQLADALGWTVVRVGKAVALGVLPLYDLKTPRWKAATVDALVGRRSELSAALDERALFTEEELIARLGLEYGEWRRGRDHDVIPVPTMAPSGPARWPRTWLTGPARCARRSRRSRWGCRGAQHCWPS